MRKSLHIKRVQFGCGGSAGGHVALGTALFDSVEHADEELDVSCKPNALVLLFSSLYSTPHLKDTVTR